MSDKESCILNHRPTRSVFVRILAVLTISLLVALLSPALSGGLFKNDIGNCAYAALIAGSASSSNTTLTTASSNTFKTSKTRLDLTPKKKKITNGYKYVARSKAVTITAPSNCTVYWESSDHYIADAKWGKFNKKNEAKLTITGHARGTATITVTNSKTSKKLKIKVTVGGGEIGFDWCNPVEKRYTKPDGTNGYYMLNNIMIYNKTGKTISFDKKCVFKKWTTDLDWYQYDEWSYVAKGEPVNIRNLSVKIKNGKKKRVYLGAPEYADDSGNYDQDYNYYYKACFTLKVGKAYKTVYVDKFGMVTKVRNGRDF